MSNNNELSLENDINNSKNDSVLIDTTTNNNKLTFTSNNNNNNNLPSSSGISTKRVINEDYLSSLNDLYKCNICFNIMINPTDCETCGHSYCYDCIYKLKCPFGCEEKKLKSSSTGIRALLNGIIFKCENEGCNEEITYSNVLSHDTNCDYQKVECPSTNCGIQLPKKELEKHIKDECKYAFVACKYCNNEFMRVSLNEHEKICQNVVKVLNGDMNIDLSEQVDAQKYLEALSLNISKMIKERKEEIKDNNDVVYKDNKCIENDNQKINNINNIEIERNVKEVIMDKCKEIDVKNIFENVIKSQCKDINESINNSINETFKNFDMKSIIKESIYEAFDNKELQRKLQSIILQGNNVNTKEQQIVNTTSPTANAVGDVDIIGVTKEIIENKCKDININKTISDVIESKFKQKENEIDNAIQSKINQYDPIEITTKIIQDKFNSINFNLITENTIKTTLTNITIPQIPIPSIPLPQPTDITTTAPPTTTTTTAVITSPSQTINNNNTSLLLSKFNSLEITITSLLETTLKSIFRLKWCTDCEQINYFYAFMTCSLCNKQNCKKCVNLCLQCKHILCKTCSTCPNCSKPFCTSCRIQCQSCNPPKKYCLSCLNQCQICTNQYCLTCLHECSDCKSKTCSSISCAQTCKNCAKIICSKCPSYKSFTKCKTCNELICDTCISECTYCESAICHKCLTTCYQCKRNPCKNCISNCGLCNEIFCITCSKEFKLSSSSKCEICLRQFCFDCFKKLRKCKQCNKIACKGCTSTCRKCINIYCHECSIQCDNCNDYICANCINKCTCDMVVFCENCLLNINSIGPHDCVLFMNESNVFCGIKSRSKLKLKGEFEAKFFIEKFTKEANLLIGVTDNNTFDEDSISFVDNIWGLKCVSGEKYSSEKYTEKFIDKGCKEGDCVLIALKNNNLFLRVNNSEIPSAFDLNGKISSKEGLWIYIENDAPIDSAKVRFVYLRKI